MTAVDAQGLLEAREGVACATDPQGVILACRRPSWDAFLVENEASDDLQAGRVLGRDLFDSVDGAAVVARCQTWPRAWRVRVSHGVCSGRERGLPA